MTTKIPRTLRLGSRRMIDHKGASRRVELRRHLSRGRIEWRDRDTGELITTDAKGHVRKKVRYNPTDYRHDAKLRWVCKETGKAITSEERQRIEKLAEKIGLSVADTQEVVLEMMREKSA